MLLAHKIELKCNNKQETYFSKACGVARKAYNWGLDEWQKEYAAGGKPTETALRRKLNSIKREKFPWMLEVTKNAPQMAIIQLGQAFNNFFAKRSGYPQFRKKWIDDRFTLTNDQFTVNDSRIRIPLLGWVRMRESLRFVGKIISATISRVANKWYVSITINDFDIIGIEDLNVKGMMRNRKLSRSIADMGWFEFRRQLEYKAAMHGKTIIVADRWLASSKICSYCDYKLEKLQLSEREWACPQCATTHDRDLNAAINLEKMAVSSTVTACGASSNGVVALASASYGAMKQEFNTKPVMNRFG